MMFRNLILSCALALGIVAAGCNENPTTPDAVVTGLAASSMSPTSVGLRWNAYAGASSYNVSWTGATSGSLTGVTTNTAVASGLNAGATYTFTVTAVDVSGPISASASSITWAGAERHDNVAGGAAKIRMYEKASTFPSGVNLSGGLGPTNVSLVASTPGIAQLAMYLTPDNSGVTPTKIVIGPVYAITEYKVAAASDPNKVDQEVYISGQTTKDLTSLDTWYLSANLESLIDQESNVKAYEFGSPTQTGNGFIVRTGTAANYHYARVLIKSVGGSILQGAYPNRYVELEVSYQRNAGVPYAKGTVGRPGVRATAGH